MPRAALLRLQGAQQPRGEFAEIQTLIRGSLWSPRVCICNKHPDGLGARPRVTPNAVRPERRPVAMIRLPSSDPPLEIQGVSP